MREWFLCSSNTQRLADRRDKPVTGCAPDKGLAVGEVDDDCAMAELMMKTTMPRMNCGRAKDGSFPPRESIGSDVLRHCCRDPFRQRPF
jgi:hypothetical protein